MNTERAATFPLAKWQNVIKKEMKFVFLSHISSPAYWRHRLWGEKYILGLSVKWDVSQKGFTSDGAQKRQIRYKLWIENVLSEWKKKKKKRSFQGIQFEFQTKDDAWNQV